MSKDNTAWANFGHDQRQERGDHKKRKCEELVTSTMIRSVLKHGLFMYPIAKTF